MEERIITTRELVLAFLSKIKFICVFTLIFSLIGAVAIFNLIPPVYQANTVVMVNKFDQPNNSLEGYLNEMMDPKVYPRYIESTHLINDVISEQGFEDRLTVIDVKENLTTNHEEGSNVVEVSYKGNNPQTITDFVNALVEESRVYVSKKINTQLSDLVSSFKGQMDEEQMKLNNLIEEFNNLEANSGLPSLILFKNNVSNSQYILEANRGLIEELKTMEKKDQVNYEQINNKIETLTKMYNSYSQKYEEARSLRSLNFATNKLNVLEEATVPQEDEGPSKIVLLAVTLILGFILSLIIVYIRYFLYSSGYFESRANK